MGSVNPEKKRGPEDPAITAEGNPAPLPQKNLEPNCEDEEVSPQKSQHIKMAGASGYETYFFLILYSWEGPEIRCRLPGGHLSKVPSIVLRCTPFQETFRRILFRRGKSRFEEFCA